MKAGQKINMKYLIIGAGGTGGVTGYYMKKAGKDVTLIARGEHLKKIQKQGLTLEKMWDKTEENISIPATDMEHYAEHPDVIFVCVKGYSLQAMAHGADTILHFRWRTAVAGAEKILS